MKPEYSAVLFDMDGLMLDTERIYYRAQQDAASQLGYKASDELMVSFVGLSAETCELTLVKAAGGCFSVNEFHDLWTKLWREYILSDGIPLKNGLLELLNWLADKDVPRAVVTSSLAYEADLSLSATGIDKYFEHVVSGDEVEQMKPAPDIYLLAAQRIGVDPTKCIALEDSDAGILSSASAGMRALMIPDLRPPSEEALNTAYTVLPTLAEAKPLIEDWLSVQ